MMKIKKTGNGNVVLVISGHLDEVNIVELKKEIGTEPKGCSLILDLTDLTLVDREAVRFLKQGENDGIKLQNCPTYVREWIALEKDGE